MEKSYLDANQYLLDAFRLARKIYDSGFVPDELIALWRGGAPVGVAVHEFLYFKGWRPNHHVVKCGSYTGIGTRNKRVTFDGSDAILDTIKPGTKVLVLDDVFDSGNTMKAVKDRLIKTGADIRLATVYWKPKANQTDIQPDFYLQETDQWLVFPHEMDGLTPEEMKEKDPELYRLVYE